MQCPFCGNSGSKVVDSRPIQGSSVVRRRRECSHCHKRFTTYERLEEIPLIVVKSDRRRETFDRNKLQKGIIQACLKRPISIDTIEKMVDDIERELANYIMEVDSKVIGKMVLKQLEKLDEVAYVRFASIHQHFDSIDTFLTKLKKMKRKRKEP